MSANGNDGPKHDRATDHLVGLIKSLIASRDDWKELTGGNLAYEKAWGPSKLPNASDDEEERSPASIRRDAIALWRTISDEMIGWALNVEAIDPLEYIPRPAARTAEEEAGLIDRHLVRRALSDSDLQRSEAYTITVLPTSLAARLEHDLELLDYGETKPMFRMIPGTNYRDRYRVNKLELHLMHCVRYLYGTGLSWDAARRRVSEAVPGRIVVSTDSLRNWDREAQKKGDEIFGLQLSTLRGAFDAGSDMEAANARAGTPIPNADMLGRFWRWFNSGDDPWEYGRHDIDALEEIGRAYLGAVSDVAAKKPTAKG